jgi:tRNA(Arg) A34 adenosine deaminase TadA
MVLSNKEMNYICLAKAEAEKSKVLHQHGCIAVVNGKIMAKGHNDTQRTTSRDNFIKNTCSCHAEIACIRNLYYQISTNAYGKYSENIKVG